MWRRDPALFSRNSIRRSSETVPRSSRCFSATRTTRAKHNDESNRNGRKKPEGMSDLDWMRQRHLRRYWRKRIEDDPYNALFGASEDMLRGRGLEGYIQQQKEMHRKGMEWVEKMVPNWVLEDMGLRNKDESESKKETPSLKDESKYPKKVKIESDQNTGFNDRSSTFSAPSDKPIHFERKLRHEGVDSPSDSRRPRENPTTPLPEKSILQEDTAQELRKNSFDSWKSVQEESKFTSGKANSDVVMEPASIDDQASNLDKKAHLHEASFIEDFLADRTPSEPPTGSRENTNVENRRQTVLDRRAKSTFSSKQRRKTDISVVDVNAKYGARQGNDETAEPVSRNVARTEHGPSGRNPVSSKNEELTSKEKSGSVILDFRGAPSSRVGMKEIQEFPNNLDETVAEEKTVAPRADTAEMVDKKKPAPPSEGYLPRLSVDNWLISRPPGPTKPKDASDGIVMKNADDFSFGFPKQERPGFPRRSASVILEQLPKDDIDFLTADEVRASMGRTKKESGDKSAIREKLEYEYQKSVPELDPMLETQVVNGQYVRRKTSELAQAQDVRPIEVQPATTTPIEKVDEKPVSVLETSLDFMSRWLHTGGNVFAQHFWQDPVQLAAGQLSGADEEFYKGIGVGVLKGRRAFAIIKDELIEDIPAAEKLVSRLNSDEIKASAGAVRLYRDLPSALKDSSDEAAFKVAAHARVAKLRQALLDTDKQFKEACEVIDGMKNASKPGFMLQKRMRFAAEVLRKNSQLTRMAIFGLQGRIEVSTGSDGLVFRELLHRLLTLQDTQLALSRLVSRAMQAMGINPNIEEDITTKKEDSTANLENSVEPEVSLPAAAAGNATETIDNAAVDKKLEEEVSHLKDAMIGLSDDGYKHPPRTFFRKSFEQSSPLAHSLFRPFGLQLDSLGKDADADGQGVLSAAKKEKGDRELVREVRKAYEDVYGPITIDHVQVATDKGLLASNEEVETAPEAKAIKKAGSIQMLKEDDLSPSIATEVLEPEGNRKETSVQGAVPNIQPEIDQTTSTSPPPDEQELAYDASTDTYVPISYRTLIYNAQTDKLSVTTSPVPHPAPTIAPMPLHEALATLSYPSKFIDHLPGAFHVVSAKSDVLTVRTASPFSATAEMNVTTSFNQRSNERLPEAEEVDNWKGINPVDGTTTLSPTGFEGVGSDLERDLDFQERRRKAQEYNMAKESDEARKQYRKIEKEKKRKGRVGFGGVVKTAIWAGALCYVVGVVSEVVKVPL